MNLADINEVKALLKKENFSFKKSLGQNFLTDGSVCPRMAAAAADGETGVLEIGPGIGVLTAELSLTAKKVVSLEVDRTLIPILEKTLGDRRNVKVIFADVLETDIKQLIKEEFPGFKKVAVCANLPYYITSKIIMKILRCGADINSLTVMVQKEVADRICAPLGSRAAGLFTAEVDYYAAAERLFEVPKDCFLPSPKVDSAVIRLKARKKPPVKTNNEKLFFSLLSACFAQRRKTLVNSVSNIMGIDKDFLKACLEDMGLNAAVRGEALDMKTLAELSNKIAAGKTA